MTLVDLVKKYSMDSTNIVNVSLFESPVGEIVGAADEDFVYLVTFNDSKNLEKYFETLSREVKCKFKIEKNKLLDKLEEQMNKYFDGKLKTFKLPLQYFGSEFQKEVWNKLLELPYASTQTYGDLAKALGRSGSHARAVGAACGANKHILVVPCHRLVASGTKGGFSCGVDRKEWLLQHEHKYAT